MPSMCEYAGYGGQYPTSALPIVSRQHPLIGKVSQPAAITAHSGASLSSPAVTTRPKMNFTE